MTRIAPYAKALCAALAVGAASLAQAAGDGITAQESLTAAALVLGGGGLVYIVPNKPAS